MDEAMTKVAISNKTLYETSSPWSKTVPTRGPIMNPATKKPVNLEIFLTRDLPSLTFEIMVSAGGQKNACATPVMARKIMTSGTLLAKESKNTDAVLIPIPKQSSFPALNL